jgi:hypothetical protein
MDQENVVFIHNGILFSHKEEEILSFASKWMELAFSEPGSENQKLHVLPHMWITDSKQCSNIIGHGSHTKGRMHTEEIGKGKET